MFRDLKEYQEIAKIYAEKVSKPEDLEEMTGGLGVQSAQKMQKDIKSGELKQKPEMKNLDKGKTFIEKGGIAGAIKRVFQRKSREEVGLKPKVKSFADRRAARTGYKKPEKKLPTTAEIRAKDDASGGKGMSNIPKAEGSAVIDGKKINPDFKKKPEIEKKEPEVSTTTSQGKPRTRAQMMAAKRIASGKSIQDVKDENKAKMIANARARNVDFKAKRRPDPKPMPSNFEGGVSGKGKATDDFSKDPKYQSTAGTSTDIKKPVRQMGRSAAKRRQMAASRMEEYTPYDIVLEYLLSSKQAATIEEANYIMTEMDAKTIQSIVAE